jgi:hypothetical protein
VSEDALNLYPKFVLSFNAFAIFSLAANAQSIEVPFNWKVGNASDYALEVTAKRPEAPGAVCTVHGKLKLEVLARTATTADIRTTPSGLNFKSPCLAPSLRQTLLMRLNGVAIESTVTPSTTEAVLKDVEKMRKALSESLYRNLIWLGETVSPTMRAEILEQFEPILTGDLRFLISSTGLIEPLTRFVDETADVTKPIVTSQYMPSPFGSEKLPGSIEIVVVRLDEKLNEATFVAHTRYEQAALTAAFHQFGLKVLGDKIDAIDRAAVFKRNYASNSTVKQRVNTSTGWLLESHFVNTVHMDSKLLLDEVKLRLIPN